VSQLTVTPNAPPTVWSVSGPAPRSVLSLPIPLTLTWATGAPDILPAGKVFTLQSSLTTRRFDRTNGPWLIATYQGLGLAQLVPGSSFSTLDSLYSGHSWAVLAWILRDRVVDWQQS
jgi:hypothetical protein